MHKRNGSGTVVTVASLISVSEVMQLAGADHLTLSPRLLSELAQAPVSDWKTEEVKPILKEPKDANGSGVGKHQDQAVWRLAFSRDASGESEGKLARAISIFCDMQDNLETLIRQYVRD